MSKIGPLLQDGVNPKWIKKNKNRIVIYPSEDVVGVGKNVSSSGVETSQPNESISDVKTDESLLKPKRSFSEEELKCDNLSRSLGRRASTCLFLNYEENCKEDNTAANENVACTTEKEMKAEAEKNEVGEEGPGLVLTLLHPITRIFVRDSDCSDMETLMGDDNGDTPRGNNMDNIENSSSSEILHLTLHQVSMSMLI